MEDGEGLRVENNPGKAIVVEPWGRRQVPTDLPAERIGVVRACWFPQGWRLAG
jgi:hypothetical protein